MTAEPASAYLVEFAGGAQGPIPASMTFALGDIQEAPVASLGPTPEERAYDDGYAKGRSAARSEFEARLEQQRVEFEKEMLAARQGWCREQAEKLSQQVTAALATIERDIADAVAGLLKPFLADSVYRHAVEELRACLTDILAREPATSIRIWAPEDMLSSLRQKLGETPAITYVANDACDVRVLAGSTSVETRIGTWLRSLKEGAR